MLEYAILVALYWGAFYVLYALAFRRQTFFRLNRFYLLGALLAGMILPLLKEVHLPKRSTLQEPASYLAPMVEGFEFIHELEYAVLESAPEVFPWKLILVLIYLLGAGVYLVRLVAGMYKIARLRAASELARYKGYTIARTPIHHQPFSFGRTLYLSQYARWTAEEETDIIGHELAHIRDGHTLDVLLLEILGVIWWFSPPFYLYRHALRLQHEYIADAEVLRRRPRREYGLLLIRQALPSLQPHIAHSFHSSLKQRISMMTKTQSNPRARWLYLAAAPLTFALVLLFSQRQAIAATVPELSNLLSFVEEVDQSPLVLPAATAPTGNEYDVAPVLEGCEREPEEIRASCSEQKFLEWAAKRISYPQAAREANITGTVKVRYTISANGTLTDLVLLQDIGGGCGEQLMKALQRLSAYCKWTPAMKNGKPVAITRILPADFSKIQAGDRYVADNVVEFAGTANTLTTSYKGALKIFFWEVPEKEAWYFVDNKLMSAQEFQQIKPSLEVLDIIGMAQDTATAQALGAKTYFVITKHTIKAVSATAPAHTGAAPSSSENDEIFKIVEEMPRFQGCEEEANLDVKKSCADRKMLEFIYQQMRYPAAAREAQVEGTVVVSFIVEKDGGITNAKILREIGGGCGEEVLRVVNLMPRWIPGRQRGREVRVQYNLPVRFKMDATAPNSTPEKAMAPPPPPPGDWSEKNTAPPSVPPGKVPPPPMPPQPPATTEHIYNVVDEMPRFQGCEEETNLDDRKSCADRKMLEFIYQQLRYPAAAREAQVEGIVVVSFIVEKDGGITNAKILREIGGGCGEEVLRVVNLMPRWIPGKQHGEVVPVRFNLPVRFKLDALQSSATQPKALPVEDFRLYPNPNGGKFTLQFKAPQKPTRLQVLDAKGSAVLTRNIDNFSGVFREELDMGKTPKGQYVLVISQGDLSHTINFVRQ